MRIALRGMTLPEDVLAKGLLRRPAAANGQGMPERGPIGEVVTIVVVTVVFTEVIIEAFAIAVGVTVTATVAVGAAEAITRRQKWRDECDETLKNCLGTPLGGRWSRSWHETRCTACWQKCTNPQNKKWPAHVDLIDGKASCTDW
ncbi:hypothetical protein [Polyangium fumosum]|uniref:Uncharacterized protein n=1 Tax=Polyangium fumosum TaxID=889272 RepID=A0A4U1J4V4_9BACT|nr:hypothetical protein [Polyangium fumosum]TKD02229.1 hypothetical protein E8A74_29075 [Polyangium fumosum]